MASGYAETNAVPGAAWRASGTKLGRAFGLECGIISDRCGGMDTISLGPSIINPHSPDEALFIPSLSRTWNLLKTLLLIEEL